MGSDFSVMGKAARELIPVPELSIEAIRRRSRDAALRGRVRALVVGAATMAVVLGAGAAFGEVFYDGVRAWLSGGNSAVVVRSLAMVRQPTALDLHNAIAHASFPIIFPVGLPAGTHVRMIMSAPAEHPTSVTVDYENQGASFNVGIALFDSSVVNTDSATLPTDMDRPAFRAAYHWQIGRETVLIPKSQISSSDVNSIKAAMMKVSPAESADVTDTMLRRIIVLDDTSALTDTAERYAPVHGRSVLLGLKSLRQIPNLVVQGKALLDNRIVYLSNIPSAHGEPDYSKATLNWPKVVAVPEGGVRAIDAVLHLTGKHDDCSCEILFNQPNKTTYWVWMISASASHSVSRFSVDANTFVVKSVDCSRD